jgi:XapX domain-containing protein
MREILQTLMLGTILGSAFAFFRQPIPAPPTLAGVAGILGILLGFRIGLAILEKLG